MKSILVITFLLFSSNSFGGELSVPPGNPLAVYSCVVKESGLFNLQAIVYGWEPHYVYGVREGYIQKIIDTKILATNLIRSECLKLMK